MFHWLLNTPFIYSTNQLTGSYLIRIFTGRFFQTYYWNLDFNSNNSTKYVQTSRQKTYSKNDKICVFEKNPHENYHCENKYWVEWSRISLSFSKSMPWLVWVYMGSFFNLYITLPWYHQNGKLMKGYIFETFASCSQVKLPLFLWHFGTPFSNGKNETKWQDKWGVLDFPPPVH